MDCRVKPGNDEREVVSGRQKQKDRPGHSCPKVGVATLAYVPGVHTFLVAKQDVDGRDKPGHDEREVV